MCGLRAVSTVIDQSAANDGPVSQPQSKSWFSRLVATAKVGWLAIANVLPPPKSAMNNTSDSFASELSPVASTKDPSMQSTVGDALAEEQSVMTALRTVGLHLTKIGFEPGRDFSIGEGKLLLNAYAYDYLQQTMEPDHFNDIVELSPALLFPDNRAAMTALSRHLGVDFFANLRETMLVRLPTLSDAAMLGYASRLIQGMSHRHPEIKGFEHWVKQVVHEAIDADRLRRIETRRSVEPLVIQDDDGWVLLIDLLMAAGGKEDVHFCRTVNGVIATDDGKTLLSQLIAGPTLRVVDLA